jgi:hypothetical protein
VINEEERALDSKQNKKKIVGCNNFLRACFVLAVAACLVAIGLSAGGGNGRSLSVAACDGDDGTGRMKKADALSRPEGHGKKGRLSLLSSLLLPTIPFPPPFSPCATSNRSRSDQISRCHCSISYCNLRSPLLCRSTRRSCAPYPTQHYGQIRSRIPC